MARVGLSCDRSCRVVRLNAQSPSTLQWRLRVEDRHARHFGTTVRLVKSLGLVDPAAAHGRQPNRRSSHWRAHTTHTGDVMGIARLLDSSNLTI